MSSYRAGVVLAVSELPPYGFELVRRGYDLAQVDDYLSTLLHEADLPVDPPSFRIVRRGYDRRQVDEVIRDILAEKGIDG